MAIGPGARLSAKHAMQNNIWFLQETLEFQEVILQTNIDKN